jgi:hypothetical protein
MNQKVTIENQRFTKSRCPRCGAIFTCNHERIEECHCMTIPLDATQLEFIGQNYDGCLCHDCLEDVVDSFYEMGVNPRFLSVQV